MCGIAGFWEFGANTRGHSEYVSLGTRMSDALHHRGPDGVGVWADSDSGVVFAHRRLAIVDLSETGRQPMESASGRYQITFNGEIYNFLELRKSLVGLGESFKGTSDTEVLLHCIERYGLYETLRKVVGMFAFALWDRLTHELHLARDRIGKKPLYFGRVGSSLTFASELKAMEVLPGFDRSLDPLAVADFLRLGYIPAPRSIYKSIQKVPAGGVITIRRGRSEWFSYEQRVYWSLLEEYASAQCRQFSGTLPDAVSQLHVLLDDAVRMRMIADVPLGAFLSGGIDSTAIVALMQKQSTEKIKTFTIGFIEDEFNEAGFAKRVASHLGTDHTELYLTAGDALSVVDRLPDVYDEPFADCSQIPTILLSELASKHVKVALSGDGGDELFYGYKRYDRFQDVWKIIGMMPRFVRRLIAGTLISLGGERSSSILNRLGRPIYGVAGGVGLSQQLEKIAALLGAANKATAYEIMNSHWMRISNVIAGSPEVIIGGGLRSSLQSFADKMMAHDAVRYLPDDILVKVDRATMATSLEGRSPLLDHRVMQFAFSLPVAYKKNGSTGKVVLRQVLGGLVPSQLWDRPKKGFGVPIGAWLRSELRDWAESLLAQSSLDELPYINSTAILSRWNQHLAGQADWSDSLWDVLMLQAWRAKSKNITALAD